MNARHKRGFTLIELMIVLAIVGVLASIAIPLYQNQVFRARQAEAYVMLSVAKNAQYAFFGLNDCFAPTELMPAGVPGPTPQQFTSAPSGYVLPCDGGQKSMDDIGMVPAQANVYFRYQCDAQIALLGAGTDEFVCSAQADLDGDGSIVEFIFCTDQDHDGVGLPSVISGAACNFPNEAIRVSMGMY